MAGGGRVDAGGGGGGVLSVQADPKPAKRIRDPRLVANFSARASCCCVCGEGRHAGLHGHHVLLRSRGGDDVTANLVALCAVCHRLLHDGDAETRFALGKHIALARPDVVDYLSSKLGTGRDFMWREYGL